MGRRFILTQVKKSKNGIPRLPARNDIFLIVFTIIFSFFVAGGVFAQGIQNPLPAFSGPGSIPILIGMVLRALFGIIGTVALVIFIYGGFLWLTAFGEEQKVKKGWDTMIWAGLGLGVIFGSYVAVDFILKAILD